MTENRHAPQWLSWTWTFELTNKQLESLSGYALSTDALQLQVHPSGNPDFPHRVRVHVSDGDPGDLMDLLKNFNELLQRNRVTYIP